MSVEVSRLSDGAGHLATTVINYDSLTRAVASITVTNPAGSAKTATARLTDSVVGSVTQEAAAGQVATGVVPVGMTLLDLGGGLVGLPTTMSFSARCP